MQIPFVNLKRLHFTMQPALSQVLNEVIESEHLMGREFVGGFEQALAGYLGVPHAVACANGTDALEIIMRALGIGAGDEVIVPANGWLSAAEVSLLLGATPVFVEPDPDYYTITASRIAEKMTVRTKAIVPIHLYGLPAGMPAIKELAARHQVKLIEDCAQAHGAAIGPAMAGSFGDAAAFSFYPTKNLGALGDGGMIVTHDAEMAERCRIWASHGQTSRNWHEQQGRNSRMDALQAAVLQAKLPQLDARNRRRAAIAAYYLDRCKELDMVLPATPEGHTHVFHLFVIRSRYRNQLARFLQQRGIATEIHYPHALPDMPVFRPYVTGAFPIASTQAQQLLSIPVYPELSDAEVEYVAEQLRAGVLKYAVP